MAGEKRAVKLEANPGLSIERLPVYAGYFEGEVDLIRARDFVGVPTELGERRCVPDVYEVVHYPENGVKAHAHIILLEDYIDAIKKQMDIDGTAGADNMTKKLAFPAAINMLIATMERNGFFCHNGDLVPVDTTA